MAVIDHLVYAVPDLASGVDAIESELGVRAAYGGAHAGRGTHNSLLSFGTSYLEIIAPDPDQPDPDGPRPFGVSTEAAPCLATFAVRPGDAESIDSLVAACREVGHDPGDVIAMSRTTPDDETLNWRLTMPTMAADGLVPFLIDWGDTPHPAASAPAGGQLLGITGSIDEPDHAGDVLSALGLDVVATAGDDGLTASIQTPSRVVTL